MSRIQNFQAENGLKPDGIIGRNTISKFKEIYEFNDFEVSIFLGQLHHETSGFTLAFESMNYSPKGLISTFGYYKKNPAEAWIDGRTLLSKANQETIANKVYWDKNRSPKFKLGNPNWGDGWKNKGVGSIQLTGGDNIRGFAEYVNDMSVVCDPSIIASKYYWESAIYFFEANKIWKLCTSVEKSQVDKVTAKINRATNSYAERARLAQVYYLIATK